MDEQGSGAIQINRVSGKKDEGLRKYSRADASGSRTRADERLLTDPGRLSAGAAGAVPGPPPLPQPTSRSPREPAEELREAAGESRKLCPRRPVAVVPAEGWWPGGGGNSAKQLKP